MIFEWDEQKAAGNLKKHGVSFQEAKTVFGDPLSITVADPEHSDSEDRFIDIGLTENGRLLVVAYTERGTKIRIISARLALPVERTIYEKG
ncbi:MAG TPA: BrnT family toxin [Desulfuromonadales bacterium]|nr:BrnT family toxin [Desulfuromonadales bacterium]